LQDGFNAKPQSRGVATAGNEFASVTSAHRLVAGTAKGEFLCASSQRYPSEPRICEKIGQGNDGQGNNFNGILLPIPLTIILLPLPAFFVPPTRILVLVAAGSAMSERLCVKSALHGCG
jgi:hypothetical protein